MSGTLAGPAVPRAAAASVRLSRLWAPLVVALAMHVAVLAIRPGGLAGSHVAPAARAMAVRVLRSVPTAEPTPSERAPADVRLRETPAEAAAAPGDQRGTSPTEKAPARRTRETSTERTAGATSRPEPAAATATAPAAAAMPSTAATALPAAPDYALGIRLDPGPRPLDEIAPDYPDPHLREGTVVLRLLISETGHVDNVAVVRSEPSGVFEQAALDAFGKARFAPGMAAGTPVKSQITVEVRFVPINRGARVSGRTY